MASSTVWPVAGLWIMRGDQVYACHSQREYRRLHYVYNDVDAAHVNAAFVEATSVIESVGSRGRMSIAADGARILAGNTIGRQGADVLLDIGSLGVTVEARGQVGRHDPDEWVVLTDFHIDGVHHRPGLVPTVDA